MLDKLKDKFLITEKVSTFDKLKPINLTDEQIEEMSLTGGLDGGAGPIKTPKAFKKHKNKEEDYMMKEPFNVKPKIKKNESMYKKMANSLLKEITYTEFKKDEGATPNQKINMRIKEINRKIYELERDVQQTKKLKVESEVSNDQYWKSSVPRMMKIRERLLKIAKNIQELNS